ncbi:hypothetical protein MMA231_03152 [Asticcacaulis sp. MM231]|uniref:hypothetical protein n=1 Tax=Asticcacaulis sp. MM231 TaxID=3157666 RepID=UPI0032D5802B
MTQPARRAASSLISAITVTMIALPYAGLAHASGTYLNWQSKAANAPTQIASANVVNTSNGPYPVPPSPYGQVGDPYARALRWPAKAPEPAPQNQPQETQAPQPQAAQHTFVAVPKAPVRAPQAASISTPVPLSAPRPVEIVPVPPVEREDPGLADDPGMADDAPYIAPAPVVAAPQPKPATSHAEQMAASKPIPGPIPAPKPAPAAPVAAKQPDAGYQVPATSKYAARIESARAAQAQTNPTVATVAKPYDKKPGDKISNEKAPEKTAAKPAVATAPEPSVSMAVRETDHVFIPGEQYTSAADEPRYYSLHRQYGLRPDPIPATHEASGALPGGTIDTVEAGEEGGDPNNDTDNTSGKTANLDKKSASH